jgi:ribosomal protein L37AE/L43A
LKNKICTKCKQEKSVSQFPKEKKRKDGYYPWCKPCLSLHRIERYRKIPRKIWIENKVCSQCKETKHRSQFLLYEGKNLHYQCIECENKTLERVQKEIIFCSSCKKDLPKSSFIPSRQNSFRTQCKECARQYINKNKEKIKNNTLLKYYGITLEEYNRILNKQNHKCAICEIDIKNYGKYFSVDHAHSGSKEGLIRGLCCDPCNRFILWKHTEGKLLRKAADYLDSNGTGLFVPEEFIHGPKKKRKKNNGKINNDL